MNSCRVLCPRIQLTECPFEQFDVLKYLVEPFPNLETFVLEQSPWCKCSFDEKVLEGERERELAWTVDESSLWEPIALEEPELAWTVDDSSLWEPIALVNPELAWTVDDSSLWEPDSTLPGEEDTEEFVVKRLLEAYPRLKVVGVMGVPKDEDEDDRWIWVRREDGGVQMLLGKAARGVIPYVLG